MATETNLEDLAAQHKALERQIQEEASKPSSDDMRVAELKRKKLMLKDEIAKLKQTTRH